MNPLVSVCITAYNVAPYISEAIEGALSQETTFPFEIVIGEDCSVDRTREICLSYQKKYPDIIHLVLHDTNVGVAKNDIAVVKKARGKYLAWCDGDDYWIDKGKLQKQVDVLEKNEDVSLVHTDWLNYYEESGKKEETRIKVKEVEKTVFGIKGVELLVLKETTGCRFSSAMFRREYFLYALQKNPQLFLLGHVCNDFALFIAMYERGRFVHIPEVSTIYRIRKESLSITQSKESRFRYLKGYLCLIVHIIHSYNLSNQVRDMVCRQLIGVLLQYTYENREKQEAESIKEIANRVGYKLTLGQEFLYKAALGNVMWRKVAEFLLIIKYNTPQN